MDEGNRTDASITEETTHTEQTKDLHPPVIPLIPSQGDQLAGPPAGPLTPDHIDNKPRDEAPYGKYHP
jgi:hypothetical protein